MTMPYESNKPTKTFPHQCNKTFNIAQAQLRTVALLFALVALSFGGLVVDACSCLPGGLPYHYNISSDVMRVRILRAMKWSGPTPDPWDDTYIFLAVVMKVYKGCTKEHDFVILQSYQSSATCGIYLKPGNGQWLVTASPDDRPATFWVNSCGYNRQWTIEDVPKTDRQFLNKRNSCCTDNETTECSCVNGRTPKMCKADPCIVNKCNEPGAKCTPNFCGGVCHAEWSNLNGHPVCTKCKSDEDCTTSSGLGFDQVCTSQGCRSKCDSTKDCDPGYICNPKERICVKYTVDYTCKVDDDCVKKNVGNCCGSFPACVNTNFTPDPKQSCPDYEEYGICGFPTIDRCICNSEGQCEGK